ncbi:MAG: hypothetical protein ACOX1I_03920 [Dethiobacteria bacterium]
MFSNIPPEAHARELLFKLKINTVPTPVEDICTKLGIELIMTPKITSEAIIIKKLDTGETKIIVKPVIDEDDEDLYNEYY